MEKEDTFGSEPPTEVNPHKSLSQYESVADYMIRILCT